MKRLILFAVVVLGSLNSFASSRVFIVDRTLEMLQEEYIEIKTDELSEAVKTALKTTYPDVLVDKAYINDKKEYKIEITVGDQKATVYADANGNWIKK